VPALVFVGSDDISIPRKSQLPWSRIKKKLEEHPEFYT
jgi:hypothetical protein